MTDRLPTMKCPLKLMGLLSNPSFVKNCAETPGYMSDTQRERPEMMRCEREKCGFYSKYHYEETVVSEDGQSEHDETRVVEGCSFALLPERLHDVAEMCGAIDDVSSGMVGIMDGLAKAGAVALGIGTVLANKYGMRSELEKVVEAVRGEEEEEEEEGEEEIEEEEEERV